MTGYLIIDVGTGNLRVAVCDTNENILAIERTDIRYYTDEAYTLAEYFRPEELWNDVKSLIREVTGRAKEQFPELDIIASTSTSQREGVVLVGAEGQPVIGLPNHDHRGRKWEDTITQKDLVYEKTGRKVSSLFSALKIRGIQERYPELMNKTTHFTSISDWIGFQMTGKLVYEHTQASETQLYDVRRKKWDDDLCEMFSVSKSNLPVLASAGTTLGPVREDIAAQLNLDSGIKFVVGGADTQMAINSTAPALDDLVIVAGTTTPIVKVTDAYILDPLQRTWTNSHLFDDQYIFEVNAGVTGLNLQRLKSFFYPAETYAKMEEELASADGDMQVVASLGSLICSESTPLNTGGFVFNTPIGPQMTRADFVHAALWDMAFSIRGNVEVLREVQPVDRDFMWMCGGGAQGSYFTQLLADVLGVDIYIREGFRQASVTGAVKLCNKVFGYDHKNDREEYKIVRSRERTDIEKIYQNWRKIRERFKRFE